MHADVNSPAPQPTFDLLRLSPEVRRAIDEMGFTAPTPVQLATYEPAAAGSDLIVQARTGTGKTAAFGIPLVDRRVRPEGGAQALILAPTRELALQSAREIERIGTHRNVKVAAVYGGAPIERQVRDIQGGAQIVSGTPGRVLDHLRRGTLKPEDLRILVLDEADEMLSMGFARELNAIVELLPKNRQTMLFSATMDDAVQRMAGRVLRDPVMIALSSDAVGATGIAHFVYLVSGLGKGRDLIRILETEDPESAIIFCNTKVVTEQVAAELQAAGFQADWLNGDLPQNERETVLARTREGSLRYLVATDVAARGIDISHLTHVINYDFPDQIEAYVHRTGRTGRAGRTGTAISLIAPADLGSLYYVRLSYKIFPIERTLPSAGELKTRRELDRIELLREAFTEEPSEPERAVARRLLMHDDAERIVSGLLRAFLGSRGVVEDVDEQASAARRARAPKVAQPNGEPERAEDKKASRAEERRGEGGPLRRRRREGSRGLSGAVSDPSLEPVAIVAESVEPAAAPAPAEGPPERVEEVRGVIAEPSLEGDPDVTTLFLSLGRRDNVRVTDILRLFDTVGGVPKDEVGRIRIRDRHTFVGVPREQAPRIVEAMNGFEIEGRPLVVEIARAEQQRTDTI